MNVYAFPEYEMVVHWVTAGQARASESRSSSEWREMSGACGCVGSAVTSFGVTVVHCVVDGHASDCALQTLPRQSARCCAAGRSG